MKKVFVFLVISILLNCNSQEIEAKKYHNKAFQEFNYGNTEKALKEIDSAILLEPKKEVHYSLKVSFLLQLNKLNDALEIYKEFEKNNSEISSEFLLPKGIIYERLNNIEKAQNIYNNVKIKYKEKLLNDKNNQQLILNYYFVSILLNQKRNDIRNELGKFNVNEEKIKEVENTSINFDREEIKKMFDIKK